MESQYNYDKLKDRDETNLDMGEKAKRKLVIVCLICSCFMLIEFIGGLFANSVAIMTDAAHLLSDLGGFIISIFAIYLTKFPADKNFTYGFHRAEIIGAISSVFLIWILTILLLNESIQRIFHSEHAINGGIMLAISTIGLVFNVIMAYILHSSEVGGCGHHHSHDDIGSLFVHNDVFNRTKHHDHHQHDHNHSHDHCTHDHHDHEQKHIKYENVRSPSPLKLNNNSKFLEMKEINIDDMQNPKNGLNFNMVKTISEVDLSEEECHHDYSNIHSHKNTNEKGESCKQSHQHKSVNYAATTQVIEYNNDEIEPNNNYLSHKNFNFSNSRTINLNILKNNGNTDFPLSQTRRLSHRRTHNLKRRFSRLLHNLENYINSDQHSPVRENIDGISRFGKRDRMRQMHPNMESLPSFSHIHKEPVHPSEKNEKHNINVQAAMIHIIGDIIQSIGVIIAAVIIYFFPKFQIIDPIMTVLFSIIVMFTTFPIIKQCLIVIMQGTPEDINVDEIKRSVMEVNGVDKILCIHTYSLSMEKNILTVKIISNSPHENIVSEIHNKLLEFEFYHINVEVQKPNGKYYGGCKIEDF